MAAKASSFPRISESFAHHNVSILTQQPMLSNRNPHICAAGTKETAHRGLLRVRSALAQYCRRAQTRSGQEHDLNRRHSSIACGTFALSAHMFIVAAKPGSGQDNDPAFYMRWLLVLVLQAPASSFREGLCSPFPHPVFWSRRACCFWQLIQISHVCAGPALGGHLV